MLSAAGGIILIWFSSNRWKSTSKKWAFPGWRRKISFHEKCEWEWATNCRRVRNTFWQPKCRSTSCNHITVDEQSRCVLSWMRDGSSVRSVRNDTSSCRQRWRWHPLPVSSSFFIEILWIVLQHSVQFYRCCSGHRRYNVSSLMELLHISPINKLEHFHVDRCASPINEIPLDIFRHASY